MRAASRRMLAFAGLSAMAGCTDLVDLGRDPIALHLVLGPRATCVTEPDDVGRHFACIGDDTDGRLGADPAGFAGSCAGAPCSSTFERAQNNPIHDAAFFDDGGCFGVDDGVVCNGRNDVGQGGLPPDADVTLVLRYIGSDRNPVDIDAGVAHVCALTDTAQVVCWGLGAHGELGVDPAQLADCGTADAARAARYRVPLGATIRCGEPRLVPGIDTAVSVATTAFGTCIALADGTMRCFGRNADGALGLGALDAVHTATEVDLDGVIALDGHGENLCARTRDGSLHCTGRNDAGQLGDAGEDEDCAGTACRRRFERVRVGAGDVVGFAVGDRAIYVIDAEHRLFARGADEHGQLGDGPESADACGAGGCSRAFVRVALPRRTVLVRAGGTHACALLTDGRTFCFGSGGYGETGSPFFEDAETPTELVLP